MARWVPKFPECVENVYKFHENWARRSSVFAEQTYMPIYDILINIRKAKPNAKWSSENIDLHFVRSVISYMPT